MDCVAMVGDLGQDATPLDPKRAKATQSDDLFAAASSSFRAKPPKSPSDVSAANMPMSSESPFPYVETKYCARSVPLLAVKTQYCWTLFNTAAMSPDAFSATSAALWEDAEMSLVAFSATLTSRFRLPRS